jgi:hypothetical protein
MSSIQNYLNPSLFLPISEWLNGIPVAAMHPESE